MNKGSVIDYILEVEFEHEHKKYYHDIVGIEFYEDAVRAKDTDGIIVHIPRHMIHAMRIITADVWKYVDTDSLKGGDEE